MMRDGLTYASREDVQNALDVRDSARSEAQIDRVLRAATGVVEELTRRRFYPEKRTMYFDWPLWDGMNRHPWKLYLNQHELISVEKLISGGEEIVSADYFLRPDDGPPFRRIELNMATSTSFSSGDTHQRAIEVQGVFGYDDEEAEAGTLSGAVGTSDTLVTVSDGSAVGVGNLLRVDQERMVVTDRRFTASGTDLAADLGIGDSTVTVADGSALNPGEVLLVAGERLRITDIASNVLSVRRGWDGTTVGTASSGEDVFVSRQLVVNRAVLGTDAASHSQGQTVSVHTPPPLIVDLTIAEAMSQLLQERTAYARTIGTGEGEREVRGTGLADLREQAMAGYGRRARMRTV